ncbi:MAG: GAF domain-containing protein [Chloroflexota bacterium]|nr:GAF domain-containing protein [Chloroflexota bacterium]MDQ5867097.1 GAF domain-containing protein [Chloroflexota bacterium]
MATYTRAARNKFDEGVGSFRHFFWEPKAHRTFLTAIMALRLVAVFGSTIRFGMDDSSHLSPTFNSLLISIIIAAFLYSGAVAGLRFLAPDAFFSRWSKVLQVVIDILLVSALYFFTGRTQSDVYLLYSLPLLIAAEYFTLIGVSVVFGTISVALLSSLWAMSYFNAPATEEWLFRIFIPREFFFFIICLASLLHRRMQPLSTRYLGEERENLNTQLNKISDPVQRRNVTASFDYYNEALEQALDQLSIELKNRNEVMNHQLSAVFQATQRMGTANENEAIMSIMEAMGETLDCQAGMLRVIDKNPAGEDSLVLKASYGVTQRYAHATKYLDLHHDSLVVEAFTSAHWQTCRDVQFPQVKNRQTDVFYAQYAREANLHALIALPLQASGRTFGTVAMYRQNVREFSDDEIKLAKTLANYLSLTITNFKLYGDVATQARERQEALQILHDLSYRLLRYQDEKTLLKIVAENIRRILKAEVASVFLVEDQVLRRKAMDGIDNRWFPEEHYTLGQGLTGQVIELSREEPFGRVIRVNDLQFNTQVVQTNLEKYSKRLDSKQLLHLLAVPLTGQDGPMGVLRVLNKVNKTGSLSLEGFSESDSELLYTIGATVGTAITNNRLLNSVQKSLAELRQLQVSTAKIVSSLSVANILEIAISEGKRISRADHVGIVLVGENKDLYTSKETFTIDPPLHIRARDDGVTRWVIDGKMPAVYAYVNPQDHHNPWILEKGFKSYLAIPLLNKERVLGVLFFHYLASTKLDQVSPLLHTFSDQVATAITNARLYDQAQALLGVARIIGSTLDRDTLLQGTVKELTRLIRIEQAGIMLFNNAGDYAYLAAQYSIGNRRDRAEDRIPLSGNPAIQLIQETREPLQIYDVENDPLTAVIKDQTTRWNTKSMLLVPLIVKDKVIGTLGLDTTLANRHFSAEEKEICVLIAALVSAAVENVEAFEKRELFMTHLSKTSEMLASLTDLDGLYEFIVSAGASLLNAEDCSLYRVDHEENTVELVASSTLPTTVKGDHITAVSCEARAGLTAFVAATGQTLIFVGDEYQQHEAWNGEYLEHLHHLPSRTCNSLLIMPMTNSEGDVIGVLKAENKQGLEADAGFTDFDLDILSSLSGLAAVNIARAIEYGDIQKNAAKQERERLRGDLHDVLNIIHASVMIPSENAQRSLQKQAHTDVDAELRRLWKAAKYTYSELSSMMVDLGDRVLEEKGLVEALSEYAKTTNEQFIIVDSTLDVRPQPEKEKALFIIARSAMLNAVKHSGVIYQPDGRIWVTLKREGAKIILTVRDNGSGFDLGRVQAALSSRLGLKRMHQFANAINADLQIESELGVGTTITIITDLED